jgi:hypothetical protein
LARRKLRELREAIEITGPELAHCSLETHAERFLPTIAAAESTAYDIRYVVKNLLADWPADSPRLLSKIRKGDCEQWIAIYRHLAPSTLNSYISYASNFFDLAVTDGAISRSPMDGITYRQRGKPRRLTPTAEQFEAIVSDLRAQQANGHGADESADYIALSGLLGLGAFAFAGFRGKL